MFFKDKKASKDSVTIPKKVLANLVVTYMVLAASIGFSDSDKPESLDAVGNAFDSFNGDMNELFKAASECLPHD